MGILERAGVSADVLPTHLSILAHLLSERCGEHATHWRPILLAGLAAIE